MTLQLRAKASLLRTGDPESNVAICTLWFPVDQLMSAIDPKKYPWAVMGQLYNAKQGLNALVANLLANPQIRCLVIYGKGRPGINRSGTGEALYDLFSFGVETEMAWLPDGSKGWRVRRAADHEHEAYLSGEFAWHWIENLRGHVQLRLADNAEVLKVTLDALAREPAPPPLLTEPVIVTVPEVTNTDIWPAQGSGHVVRGRSVAEMFPKVMHTVMRHGSVRRSHYGEEPHMEVLNLVSVLEGEIGSPSGIFGQRDFGWEPGMYVVDAREEIPDFVRDTSVSVEADDELIAYTESVFFGGDTEPQGEEGGSGVKYTYGDRMRWWFETDQVQGVIDKLARDEDAKSGVIDLWDSEKDLSLGGSPCLNHLWLRIADSRLWLTATIRSNDMYGAWPANMYSLRALQEYILFGVNVRRFNLRREQLRLGDLTVVSESAHVYEHSYTDAETVIAHEYEKAWQTGHNRFDDPKGYYVIEVTVDGFIAATRHAPDGTAVFVYSGKTAKEVYRQIALADGISDLYHALDIGAELQKAEVALKAALRYEQDVPLDRLQISWRGRWQVVETAQK